MDFVAAWKAGSILLTGLFGVLGLVKDFKDKGTGRVTKWGACALIGIVLSTVLGFTAQLKEQSKSEKNRRDVADQTLALAKKSDAALLDLGRLLFPLTSPRIGLEWEIRCDSDVFMKLCSDHRLTPYEETPLSKLHQVSDRFGLLAHVLFFAKESDADLYMERKGLDRDIIDLGYEISYLKVPDPGRKTNATGTVLTVSSAFQFLTLTVPSAEAFASTGRIKGLRDLPGSTVVISEHIDAPTELRLATLFLTIPSGENVMLSASKCTIQVSSRLIFHKCHVRSKDGVIGDPKLE